MHSRAFVETLADAVKLCHLAAAGLRSRWGVQLRDLGITIHEDGLALQGRAGT